jgi:hypothetical protein
MSSDAPATPTLVLRLSVPAGDDFSTVAADLAVKVAQYLGDSSSAARAMAGTTRALAADVASKGHTDDITFEFHQENDELRIEATCGGRTSNARHALPPEP